MLIQLFADTKGAERAALESHARSVMASRLSMGAAAPRECPVKHSAFTFSNRAPGPLARTRTDRWKQTRRDT